MRKKSPQDKKTAGVPSCIWPIMYGIHREEGAQVKLPTTRGTIATAAYVYRYMDGSVAYIKFRALNADGTIRKGHIEAADERMGHKAWYAYDPAKHKELLYGGHRLVDAIEHEIDMVWLVEGEKDCETLWGYGEYAVSPNNGAGTIRSENMAHFKGYKGLVRIVMDNDPAGNKFASAASFQLNSIGVRWEIVKSAEDVAKSDLTDHVEAGHGFEDLVPVSILDLKLFEPDNKPTFDVQEDGFLSNFEVDGEEGEGYIAFCPTHKDTNPSLLITPTPDRWLMTCRSGCFTEDILKKQGLSWNDMFYKKSGSAENLSEQEQIDLVAKKHVTRKLGEKQGEQELRRRAGLDFADPHDKLWLPGDIATVKRTKIPWVIKGFWAEGSHGVIGGREKSLKSYWLDLMILAIVLGKPFLGLYEVKRSVVYLLIGEGDPSDRFERLRRMAKNVYGCDIEEAEGFLFVRTRACSWDSDEFGKFMKEVREVKATVVAMDSVYNFQPPEIDVQNMYDRGFALGVLSQKVGTDRTLMLVDHFRKTGSADLDLASLAQSAMGPWADSWILMKHRGGGAPEVGRFEIELSAGSRRGYNKHLDVSWHLGPFDDDEGCHTGDIAVTAIAHNPATDSESNGKMTDTGIQNAILEYMRSAYPGKPMSYSGVRDDMIGGGDKPKVLQIGTGRFKKAWDALVSQGHVIQSGTKWIVNPKPKISMTDILGGDK